MWQKCWQSIHHSVYTRGIWEFCILVKGIFLDSGMYLAAWPLRWPGKRSLLYHPTSPQALFCHEHCIQFLVVHLSAIQSSFFSSNVSLKAMSWPLGWGQEVLCCWILVLHEAQFTAVRQSQWSGWSKIFVCFEWNNCNYIFVESNAHY